MEAGKLGKKLKQLRIDHDVKQSDIAAIFGFKNYQQVSKWETGDLFPTIDQLALLSDKLKFNLFTVLVEIYEHQKLNSAVHKNPVQKSPPKKGERNDLFPQKRIGGKSTAPVPPGDKGNKG